MGKLGLILNSWASEATRNEKHNHMSEYADVKSGVGYGRILAPDLFLLHTEMIMFHTKDLDSI